MTTKVEFVDVYLQTLKEKKAKLSHPTGKGGYGSEENRIVQTMFDILNRAFTNAKVAAEEQGEEWDSHRNRGSAVADYTPEQWAVVFEMLHERVDSKNTTTKKFNEGMHLSHALLDEINRRLFNPEE